MFKRLAKQLKKEIIKPQHKHVTLPFAETFITSKNDVYKQMSEKAVELYEHKSDVNKFSKLVLSDLENLSHNDLMKDLFDSGVKDPLEDLKLEQLADNQKFLKDLGLL